MQLTKSITSFLAFERASSSEDTGNAWDDSEAYRLTMETSSMMEDTFPESLKTVRSFFLINDGGDPKSGPNPQNSIICSSIRLKKE